MMRAPVAVAMRPARARPRSRTARPVSMSIAGSPERRALAQRSIASAPTARGRGRRRHRRDAVGLVPRGVGGQDQRGDLAGRGARGHDGGGAVGGDRAGAGRGAHPRRDRARDALDVRGERRVVLDVVRRVLAHDVDDARAGLARVVEVREPVAEAGAQVQQGGGGLVGHAPVAVGRAGHHALEEAEHAADAVDLVERGHEVHLRRARIGEADVDPARHQRSRQALRTVHRRLRLTLGIAADRSVCAMRGHGKRGGRPPRPPTCGRRAGAVLLDEAASRVVGDRGGERRW